MKKILYCVTTAVITVFSAVSCKSEFPEENTYVPQGDVVISASFEQPKTDTRTSLDPDGKVFWDEGDEIALISASGKSRFSIISGFGTGSAEFSGTLSGAAPYYALYPYSENCMLADGKLKFTLPQEQNASNGNFGKGASPALATMADAGSPAHFQNLCGVLELNLCGAGLMKFKTIEILDLAGTPLWGDCELVIDGKQGTNDQTMTITGGSNRLTVNMDKQIALMASTPRVIDIVVPQGAFSKGFSVKLFNEAGDAVAFITTQNPAVKAARSFITSMDKLKLETMPVEPADTLARGYYKPVFQDGGVYLTSNYTLPAADFLGWEFDNMATNGNTATDSLFQMRVICGDEDDLNGAILYPDNEPRYRMVYMNGGKATNHGRSLTETGRSRYVTFVNNGGSYVGTCAGAYIASNGTSSGKISQYLAIYPSYVIGTGLTDSYTGMFVAENSPLLQYYDFGGDMYIDSVRHNGGCYAKESTLPAKGEVLCYYDYPSKKMHNNMSIWAYKANDTKGRVICCGSHPEQVSSGERRELMAAMMRYTTDGNGKVSTKATLSNGTARKMDQLSSAGKPSTARIGDKQYHHFKFTAPAGGAKNVTIELTTETTNNLVLSLRKDAFAWRSDADYLLAQAGGNKTLSIDYLPEGVWYISVFCPDGPKVTSNGKNKFTITGDKSVLNGVPYTIKASWE